MLKWIGGCLVLIIVLIAAASFWAMRTMKKSLAPDGSATVTIAATPSRVFASLANGDSVGAWMAPGNSITTARHGPLAPGDSIRIQLKAALGMTQPPITWHVVQVVPDQLLVLRMVGGSTRGLTAIRRDSLVAKGDSTSIVSSLTSATLDSLRKDKSNVTGDMMLSMLRIQSKVELDMLKARIEGTYRRKEPAKR
jgi:uncharacterized protein YndB with AHSA1/START domain